MKFSTLCLELSQNLQTLSPGSIIKPYLMTAHDIFEESQLFARSSSNTNCFWIPQQQEPVYYEIGPVIGRKRSTHLPSLFYGERIKSMVEILRDLESVDI